MIMKHYNISLVALVFAILLVGATPAFAQQNNGAKTNEIRDKAYATINKGYDTYATVNGDEALYSFLRLFVDEEVPVYNDLLGISSKRTLPVGDYARLFSDSHITTKRVHIKNLQMEGDPVQTDAGWQVTLTFDKEMSYYNSCGIYFSSREFYDADYRLTATLIYDEVDGQCRISRIDGTVASSNMLPMDYTVLRQTSNRDALLNYHHQPIAFNSSQQAILPGVFDGRGFSHPKFDASRLSPSIDGCNIVTMRYLSPSSQWRIKPHIGLGIGDALTLEGDSMMRSTSSSSMSLGVDFGYQFLEAGPLKLSAFAGIGITTSSMKLAFADSLYMTTAGADADGQKYERHYDGLNLNQTVKFTDLSVPLYLDAEVGLGSMFSVYADLGVRFNFNMSAKVNETSGTSGAIYGIYTEPAGIRLGEEWGYNGFAKGCDFEAVEAAELTGKKSMTLDILGSLGLRCNIPSTPLAIDLGVNYLMGMGEMLKPDKADPVLPIVYNTLSEDKLTSTEHVNLHGQIESVKRKSLQLNVGVIFKF